MKLVTSSLLLSLLLPIAAACTTSTDPDPNDPSENVESADDEIKAGKKSCGSVGGTCVGLSPSSCKNGTWADAKKVSCGGGIGVGCCVGPTFPPPPPPPPPPNACESAGGACMGLSPSACPNGIWGDASKFSCGGGIGVGCCMQPCPVLSPPAPGFCPNGTVTPNKNDLGCTVGYTCTPSCPVLSPPAPSFCPNGTITPNKNAEGCTVGYTCTPKAQNACEAAGGQCVGLSPSSCTNGTWASAATHSCGGGIGVGCCLP